MRDPKRIKKILKALENRWNEFSDMRFGQLLINLGVCEDDMRLWNLEDDITLKHLEDFRWE